MLSWVSVDARTGVVLANLNDVVMGGPCMVTIGAYNTLSLTIPYPPEVIAGAATKPAPVAAVSALADFQAATTPGRAVIIALDETDAPVWGGMVITAPADHTGAITVTLVTLEAYLDRRYTGAYSVTGRRQDLIVSDLITQSVLDGAAPGLPIRVANTASATSRDRTYLDSDDKTVFSALSDLLGVLGGPQWLIGWEWNTPDGLGRQRITPVLYVADRLGASAPAGLTPAAVFSMPGCVEKVQIAQDYSASRGANRVTAIGAGNGPTRAQVSLNAADYLLRPTLEYRWTPSTTITDLSTLTGHAQAVLALIGDGTKSLALTARRSDAPTLGVDWIVGDDVMADIWAPAWIDGSLSGVIATTGGVAFDDYWITPILTGPTIASL